MYPHAWHALRLQCMQVAQLMGQISELVVELEKRQREVQLAAADVVALKTELKASIESRDQVGLL